MTEDTIQTWLQNEEKCHIKQIKNYVATEINTATMITCQHSCMLYGLNYSIKYITDVKHKISIKPICLVDFTSAVYREIITLDNHSIQISVSIMGRHMPNVWSV